MKKYLTLLLLFIMPAMLMVSCDDKDDIPDVDLNVKMEGVSVDRQENLLYAVRGETIKVTELTVASLNGKPSALGPVTYFWDTLPFFETILVPFKCDIETAAMPLGVHSLSIKATVLQEGKSLGVAWLSYRIKIVADKSDIPAGAETPDAGDEEQHVSLQ